MKAWATRPQSIPYAVLGDPESLNLYSFVRNNPTSLIDPDGHCWGTWLQHICNTGQRFRNAFQGLGFHTDQQVEDILHRDNQLLRQHGVSTEGKSELQVHVAAQDLAAALAGLPPLRIVHLEPPLQQSASYQEWSKKTTQEIIDSLKKGAKEPLRVKDDGAVVQGNSRISVLKDRGVDVDSLERELYVPEGIPEPGEMTPGERYQLMDQERKMLEKENGSESNPE